LSAQILPVKAKSNKSDLDSETTLKVFDPDYHAPPVKDLKSQPTEWWN
jgi:hypothetical protein